MTRLEIFNIALSQHGKKCLQEDLVAPNPPTEVEACQRMYEMAVQDVLGEYDWSFFLAPIELDLEDDAPYGRWTHGYLIPAGVSRLTKVGGRNKPYLVAGNRFYTDRDRPDDLWGIRWSSAMMDNAPRELGNLVGLWLGYLISTIISPSDGNLANRILQNYSAHLQAMMRREEGSRQDNYLDPDDWSAKQA